MSKITKQNVGGTDYTMVGCALTGVCASAADAFIKAVTLSDGDEISDGMTVIVTFANGNTAGTAPASKTIFSSDQVNYYEDTGLTIPFTLAPAGCYEITYTGTGNAYAYISYPVIQIGNITGVICDASGSTVSGSLWAKGAQVGIMFKDGKFLLVSGALLNNMSALPTDAVLHYSFDDLPDYPDGTAVYFRDKNFLSGDGWTTGAGTLTYTDGILKVATTSNTYVTKSVSFSNCVVKVRVKSAVTDEIGIYATRSGSDSEVKYFTVNANEITEITLYFADSYVAFGIESIAESNTFEVYALYIGNGSYATPIIDNANGENNSVSAGGVTVQGVSGKGVKLFNKVINVGNYNLTDDFSVSIWVKPDNNISTLIGNIVGKSNHFILRNGASWSGANHLMLYLYQNGDDNHMDVGSLLEPNVWTHIVVTKSGTALNVYRNGNKTFSRTLSQSAIDKNINSFELGSTNTDRPQSVDDLLIFDRALSEAEVTALYLNRANTPKFYSASDYWEKTQVFPVSSLTYVAEKTYEPVSEETEVIEAGQYNYLVLPYILAAQVPVGYHVEYVCSWLGGTSGNNKIQVWINNIQCGEKSSYTTDARFLGASSTRFKRSDIVLEPVLTFKDNGINIKVKLIPGAVNGRAFLRSLNITAFLVKD